MLRRIVPLACAATFVLLATEARAQSGEGGADSVRAEISKAKAKRPKRSRNLISSEEVAWAKQNGSATAYDVVQQLHSEWFRTRGPASPNGDLGFSPAGATAVSPMIYVNQVRAGDSLDLLKNVGVDGIIEIRYLSAGEASTRFGSGHQHGAIIVTTR